MDIDQDLAELSDDLKKFNDGKYLYRDDDNKFDINKFNRSYDQYRERRKTIMKERIRKKLEEMNRMPDKTPIYQHSMAQILIDSKDSLFQILDDLLQYKFESDTFIKKNRLFYLGILFVFIAFVLIIYSYFVGSDSSTNNIDLSNLSDKKIIIIG